MTFSGPCPHCGGTGGHHIWAGLGHCPGVPVTSDAELLSTYTESIRLRDVEIRRLTYENVWMRAELNRRQELLKRAADMLDDDDIPTGWRDEQAPYYKLIAELRKAAE